jgi:cytochrome c-type biogenesis protein CcmH/NrfG
MDSAARLRSLLDLLEKEPDDLFLNYALALEYQNDQATIQLAEKQFLKVLSADENYIAAYYQLGKMYESQLRIEAALQYFKKGLEKARSQQNNKASGEFEEAIFMLED